MELALVELYRYRDRRHLGLAGDFSQETRAHGKPPWDDVYHFCGLPFTRETRLRWYTPCAPCTLVRGGRLPKTITWKRRSRVGTPAML